MRENLRKTSEEEQEMSRWTGMFFYSLLLPRCSDCVVNEAGSPFLISSILFWLKPHSFCCNFPHSFHMKEAKLVDFLIQFDDCLNDILVDIESRSQTGPDFLSYSLG